MNFKVWFLAFNFSLFTFISSSANELPTAEDINALAKRAELTVDTFMQQSFKLRMQYEYKGKFLTDGGKENLHKLAKSAGDKLQAIVRKQETLKQQIEDYQGDDWDDRYGLTGLWRKLSADIYTTKLSKFEIDYYLALASERLQRNQILHLILSDIDALAQSNKRFGPNLIRGKTLALLAQTEPSYKDAAVSEFEAFAVYSDIYSPTAAAIEKMKLLSHADANQLSVLVEELQSNWDDRYLELVLSLMLLQRQYDPGGFEKTVSLWLETEDLLGSLILQDISHQIEAGQLTEQSLQQINVFEAELATQAAWKNKAQYYKMPLDYLATAEKFQTPLILYVAAVAFAESSPTKAVNLLVKASNLQKIKKSSYLAIEAQEIAKQAAQLAYNLFIADSNNCYFVYDVFRNYKKLSDGQMDENLEYAYTELGFSCGDGMEAISILRKIAAGNGRFSRKALLDLVAHQVRTKPYEDIKIRLQLLKQFADSIEHVNDCIYVQEMAGLVKDTVEDIELLQSKTEDFSKAITNIQKIARFVYNCDKNNRNSLILAEISTFAASLSKIEKELAEKIISQHEKQNTDIDLYRCRARLFQKRREFEKAARLWAKIGEIQKGQTSSANRRSWKWWRAKFYELHCLAKCPQTQKMSILHTIEVLENSFQDIPPLWAEKLSALKQQCRSQLISIDK